MSIIEDKSILELDINTVKSLQCDFIVGLFEKNERTDEFYCKNVSLNHFYHDLYKKYRHVSCKMDFFAECMSYTFEAISKFESNNESCWRSIINGSCKKSIGKLITYIKKTVKHKIYEFVVNDGVSFTRGEVDGAKSQHIMVKLNLTSLDDVTVGEDGKRLSIMEFLSAERNIFTEHENYCWNFFIKWFMENKDRILTERQLKYLQSYKNYSKINKEIFKKALKYWNRENPMGKKTLLQMQKEEELQLWEGLMKIVYNEDTGLKEQNRLVSDWFIQNLEEEVVWTLVFDLLPASDCKNVVSVYKRYVPSIENKVLYKLFEAVEKRIDELLGYEVQAREFFKRDCEAGRWNLDGHRSYERYLKEFKEQPCIVYDIEGNLLRIEGVKEQKTQNMVEVTPYGTQILSKVH